MKHLYTFLFMLLLVAISSSCSQEELAVAHETPVRDMDFYNNIPVDSALVYLKSFMEDSDNSLSRSDDRIIASITPIKFSHLITRAVQEKIDCDNLLYIANFEQGRGYAILAADKRISEKVIAVTDEGTLSDATVYSSMALLNSERIIFNEYPKTGEGFFTTPETGDELFINPNTVSLYIESEQDTLVGNFGLDDIGAEDENGNPIQPTRSLSSSTEIFTSYLCVAYAVNEINYDEDEQSESTEEIIGGGGGGVSISPTRTETTTSNWSVRKNIHPILTQFKNWDQNSPFNDLYPKKPKYLFFGCKRNAPAGCFPLAISKILTHFEYPTRYTFNGYTVNWKELKSNPYSLTGRTSAAHLLKGISSGCNSLYFYAGTFTFPHTATSYMRFIGLSNAHSHSYSFNRVTSMINNGKPLIIYSVPGINITKSHCWNIDGYKIKERTITTKVYKGDSLVSTTEKKETSNMVHCDFGWGGNCNGYYVSGVFKLDDARVEHDHVSGYSGSTNYNNFLKVITY